MESIVSPDRQRAEIERVLQSGLFAKAPRLEKFFRYICERHLRGEADRIKEYSIATEALGRGSEFDPKSDSIVRVEAHRLRKRLEVYYADEGAAHLIRIGIPNGQYRPSFSFLAEPNTPALIQTAVSSAAVNESAARQAGNHRPSSWRWLAWAAMANMSIVTVAMAIQHYRGAQQSR